MMKNYYWTSLFFASFLALTSCNEKIAPALSNPTSGSTSSTSKKSFKLTEKSNKNLGYVLHKAGSNAEAKCEISEAAYESPTEGQSIPATHDITCYVEAEESFLHFNGLEFQLDADKDICEKIAYTPYSFYSWQPGSSTRSMRYANCDEYAAQFPAALPAGYVCKNYVDNITGGTTTDEKDLCVFDYSDIELDDGTGPNCDTGVVSISTISCTGEDTDEPSNGVQADEILCETPTVTQKKCGGKIGNCVAGPILEVRDKLQTNFTILYDNSELKAYTNKWKIPNPHSKGHGTNMSIANFNRQCAGVTSTSGAVVPHNPDDFDAASVYDPTKMMSYSRQGVQAHPSASDNDFNPFGFTATIFADDPFRGVSYVNPFYEFACLDGAQEIKARIRVVVRDWDRVFKDTASALSLVSDWGNNDSVSPTNITNLAFMDTGLRFLESPQNNYPHSEGFNDFWDWDDWFNPDSDVAATAIWPYNPFKNNADGSCSGIDDQGLNSPLFGPKANRNFPKWAL